MGCTDVLVVELSWVFFYDLGRVHKKDVSTFNMHRCTSRAGKLKQSRCDTVYILLNIY